uniref:GRF-type domain-containing protein n=1 Tax=Brassica oleracea var. oleracea TaxID=109376 RepID=A0A0D3D0C1_BRAOL
MESVLFGCCSPREFRNRNQKLDGDGEGDGEALISKSISSNRKPTLRLLSFTGVGDLFISLGEVAASGVVCYCGTKPLLATSNTRQDQGRRYYTCAKKDDGECHVYKWLDEALMEEMRARDIHVLQLGEKVESLTLLTDYDTEQKIRNLEKIVGDMAKEKSSFSYGFECFVIGIVVLVVVIGLEVMFG